MKSHRITIRLEDSLYQMLVQRCQMTKTDVSFQIRDALASHLQGNDPPKSGVVSAVLVPPDVFAKEGPYRAWGLGDLRKEVERQFESLLPAMHVCAEHYPRTRGVREMCAGLFALRRHLPFGGSV